MSTPPSASFPSSKPRKKRQTEDVSFEDLLAAHKTDRGPGQLPPEGVVLIGVDVELQRRMAQGLGTPSPSSAGAPNFDAPTLDAPEPPALVLSAPDSVLPATHAPSNADLQKGAPEFAAPIFDIRGLIVRPSSVRTYTVRRVTRMEDVFTSAERDLLRWLWEQGRSIPGRAELRLLTGPNGEGARRLAAQAGLIYNTFKNLTRALSTKFALDIVKPERNLPTIYAIYDNHTILERQSQAGFTGVLHKNGGGRELVTDAAQPAPRRPDLTVPQLEEIISARKFGAQNSDFGAPNFLANLPDAHP